MFADNREGEANVLPIGPAVPGGSIANLDAARLRDYLAAHGGRTQIRVGRDHLELETGRSGVITSFSSAGPTAFGHDLSPDVSAPGGQILSSTLPRVDASRFAVFDGTSMAAPHVTGSVALLLAAPSRLDGRADQVGTRLDRRRPRGPTPRARARRP